MRLVPSGRRLVFPDGHVEEGFAVEFDERDQTIAVLRAERDRLRSALRHLVNHWDEFGAEYGLDESFHLARRALVEGK
jgi:hypothetical protein